MLKGSEIKKHINPTIYVKELPFGHKTPAKIDRTLLALVVVSFVSFR